MTMFYISKGPHVRAFKTRLKLPTAGEKLVVAKDFITPMFDYRKGDILELVERTESAPFGVKCSLGNWVVKCPNFTSVWSNIEWAMIDGLLELQ